MQYIKKHLSLIILITIIFIASFLRLYQLGQIPVSPDWDEVALGYNAYSILLTGKDEIGKSFPVIIESFADFKPALYMYLSIPPIALLGLNVVATRLPSVIFGILAVIATYFLVKELFKKESLALLSAFFLAVSPWHLQFSRVALESSVGDDFNIFIALFFIKGLTQKNYLWLAALFAGLNLYVYQSDKVFTPLFVLLLIGIYWKQLFHLPKLFLGSIIVFGCLLIFPVITFTLANQNALARLQTVSIFSQSQQLLQSNILEQLRDRQNNDKLGQIVDNRRWVFLANVLQNYSSHFSFNWLFVTGDSFTIRHQPQNMGHLYLWDAIFLLIGIYILIFGKFDRKTKLLLFGWFLLAPVPASITQDVPHAVRTMNFLPTFQILIALGVLTAYLWVQKIHTKTWIKNSAISIVCILFIWNFAYYIDQYFVQYNYFASKDWQYGYTQLIPFVQQHESEYHTIIVSKDVPLDQSYIFFLFYLKYPPSEFQQSVEKAGHYTVEHHYGKFYFRSIDDTEMMQAHPGYLYITGYKSWISPSKVLKTTYFLDGKPDMEVVKG